MKTMRAPVDVATCTACSMEALRSASKAGSPMCSQWPSMRRSSSSHRPASTTTTLGWNWSRSAFHWAGHWTDTGDDELHAGVMASATPWAMYWVLRTRPQPTMAPL